jgi:GxxExxY protein
MQGIAFVRQKTIPLFYRDHQIGEHRLDFLVEDKIIVELKAVEALENVHFAIVRSYLKSDQLGRRPHLKLLDDATGGKASSPRTKLRKG